MITPETLDRWRHVLNVAREEIELVLEALDDELEQAWLDLVRAEVA